MSDEVHSILTTSKGRFDLRLLRGARPHVFKEWRLNATVASPASGLVAGVCGFVWEILRAVTAVLSLGPRAAYANCRAANCR